ncbi:Sigma-54 dependent DNA-binding response regulator [Aromatoleum aromaticum EbN1]|uniref:Sigma-54 dependent DNA-binding response regulator n=1 Tax=Aromatoleum aromaticum (strain DSM 19018 / LMG 30748 / EbN1) TaxID=76114 RepID=Q5P0J0_AROAE|nr:sigma-54 dependent transcriptional regulator [Aromatoleum aromaticum]CAI09174.1 Sigma-54 dependent DNA-binding response regulator [Aromatoleum aromaticum EbN1]
MNRHILIVDDEALYRQLLTSRLGRAGYRLSEAADGEAALECAQHGGIDLALVDIKMPGIDGIEVLKRLKELDPLIEVVILTGHGNVDTAISAMKLGAFDYLSKPYKLTELDIVVERALEKRAMAQRCAALSAEVAALRSTDDGAVIGASAAWKRMLALVRRAAPLDLPVLITGESGAGKEVVASALHRWSNRAKESYVPLNCGLLDDDLVESELFGHKRGAFSGATADKEGLFQVASAGTLFLDEIGELPLGCQAKLLRVLDSGEFRQLGATALRHTHARVVAATHRDLDKLVAEGKFRHDLLYRLNVVHIHVPPLRERTEDIPLLVEHLLRRRTPQSGPVPQLAPTALAHLVAYRWPGNVRELRNVVERLIAFREGDTIGEAEVCAVLGIAPAPAPGCARGGAAAASDGIVPLDDFQRDYVLRVLDKLDGNVSAAAQALGVSRSTVYRFLREMPVTDDAQRLT